MSLIISDVTRQMTIICHVYKNVENASKIKNTLYTTICILIHSYLSEKIYFSVTFDCNMYIHLGRTSIYLQHDEKEKKKNAVFHS